MAVRPGGRLAGRLTPRPSGQTAIRPARRPSGQTATDTAIRPPDHLGFVSFELKIALKSAIFGDLAGRWPELRPNGQTAKRPSGLPAKRPVAVGRLFFCGVAGWLAVWIFRSGHQPYSQYQISLIFGGKLDGKLKSRTLLT